MLLVLKSPGYSHAISRVYRNSIFMLYSVNKQVPLLPHGASHGIFHRTCVSENFLKRSPLNVPSWRGLCKSRWERLQTNVAYDVAGAVEVIHDLGLDTLTFLAVTVLIVPTFKSIKASPVRSSWSLLDFLSFLELCSWNYDNLSSQ